MTRIEEHVEQLLKTREALRAELESVNSMIAASGVRVQRGATTAGTKKKPGKRATTGNGISEQRLEEVFAVVNNLDEPMATLDIAKKVPNLGQSSVSKALTTLHRAGRIRHAGYVPGVKGRRPMYAPWPIGSGERERSDIIEAIESDPEKLNVEDDHAEA